MDAFAQHERARLKAVLDATSDFAIAGSRVTFAQHFETVCAKEPFCVMPDSLVESCRRLLDADICSTIPTIVHRHVFVTIGCNTFPLFALESGGVGRTLFRFPDTTTSSRRFRKYSTSPTSSANGTTPLSHRLLYLYPGVLRHLAVQENIRPAAGDLAEDLRQARLIPRPRNQNHSLYRRHLEDPNDFCIPLFSVPGKDTTFTIDGAQWTYEADTNGKKCKSINSVQCQAQTKTQTQMISHSRRFPEHSDNFPVAHDSERGWVVVRLDENELLNSVLNACEKHPMVVQLNVDCTLCQL